jgi:hypothetical protein
MNFFKSDLFLGFMLPILVIIAAFATLAILIWVKSVREWLVNHWFGIMVGVGVAAVLSLLMYGVGSFSIIVFDINSLLDSMMFPFLGLMTIVLVVLLLWWASKSGLSKDFWKNAWQVIFALVLLVLAALACIYLVKAGAANMAERTLAMVQTNKLLDEQRRATSQFQTENSQDSQRPSAPPSTQERSNENTSDATDETQEGQNFRSPVPAEPLRNLQCYQQHLADKSGYVQLQSRHSYAAQPPSPCRRSSEGFRMSNPRYHYHQGYTGVNGRMHRRENYPAYLGYYRQ